MEKPTNATAECGLFAQFTDRGKPETQEAAPRQQSEASHPRLLGEFVDHDRPGVPLLHFVVLMKDNKSVRVQGHGIEAGPGNTRQVVRFLAGRKTCVAMFESANLIGIYEGKAMPA